MSRNKPYSGATLVAFIVGMLAMVALVACQMRPMPVRPLDLHTVQPCAEEDGSGSTQTYPCVWDAQTMGNGQAGPYAARWTIYVDGPCTFATMQDGSNDVHCVDVREWAHIS